MRFHPPLHLVVAAATVVGGLASYQGVDHLVLSNHSYQQGDGNGNAITPPSNEIENPDPMPGTNNWYTQDGYSGGTYSNIDDPLGIHGSRAIGINNAGQIVGTYRDDADVDHGFLYSGGFFTTIDNLSTPNGTLPQAINDAGQIVGFVRDANDTDHGFLETTVANPAAPAGMRPPSDFDLHDPRTPERTSGRNDS